MVFNHHFVGPTICPGDTTLLQTTFGIGKISCKKSTPLSKTAGKTYLIGRCQKGVQLGAVTLKRGEKNSKFPIANFYLISDLGFNFSKKFHRPTDQNTGREKFL